jgi:hypothetical protein
VVARAEEEAVSEDGLIKVKRGELFKSMYEIAMEDREVECVKLASALGVARVGRSLSELVDLAIARIAAPADDTAEVLAGLLGPEAIDAAARALCAEWVETQLKEPVRKFCEYDQLTTEGRDVWRRMARRAISAAQQRLAERGQGRGEG